MKVKKPVSESESEEVCEVERIIGKQIAYGEVRILGEFCSYFGRFKRKHLVYSVQFRFMSIGNQIQYLIKWKDYSSAHNSWEPIGNLNCPTNIEKYEAKNASADDTLKWVPKPTKILSSQLIDEKV